LKFKIIHQDCDPDLANNKELPTNSFLVEYVLGKTIHYDIVMSNKTVDIFDHYYDTYREDFITFNQTEGRINPKLWGYTPKDSKKEKK
tara:strand:+ start:2250 stop:2513 length:264 start_codon:yes stop_codon:yes gene_type:complete